MAKTPVVLVVDDDLHVVDILESVLRTNGFDPISAADGEEALQLVKEKKPDLILLDLMLPRLDGYGVLEALRSDPGIGPVPIIIVVSARTFVADVEKAFDKGANDYLSKPFQTDRLLAKIKKHLSTPTR